MNPLFIEVTKEAATVLKKNALPLVKEGLKDLSQKLVDNFKQALEVMSADIVSERFEVLDMAKFKAVAKNNIVPGADGLAAMIQKGESSSYLYLACTKDKELLPKESNKYVVIKANYITDEVKSLFAEQELIIIK